MKSLIRKCIDVVKDDIDGVCADATPGSSNCLNCFQKQYFDENLITYDCNYKINIYVAKYFPVHVKENSVALNLLSSDFMLELFKHSSINIMSIGGGPGSDSYAVKKYLTECENQGDITSQKDIYLLRVDKEENWNNTAGEVNSIISDTGNLIFNAKRHHFDVTIKEEWMKRSFRTFNIFTISYFLSELTDKAQVETVAECINRCSSEEVSCLFINDRNDEKVRSFQRVLFDNLSCNTDYEVEDSSRHHCGFFYDNDDKDLISPKLSTKSIRFLKVLYI